MAERHDLIILGAGPGGYIAAIRAAQLGLNVACVEKESRLGGTCLRIGCIPSKALLESSEKYYEAKKSFRAHGIKVGELELNLSTMLKRKDSIVSSLTKGVEMLFKKNGVTRYEGHGRIAGKGRVVVDNGGETIELEANNIIIATGSRSANLPGIELDYDRIGTSTEGLAYTEVPERLVVIGAGYIGLELGSVWCRLGSKVTVLEYLNRIMPGMDTEVADEAKKILEKQGLQMRLGSKVTGARVVGDHCLVECEGMDPIECDRVLVAVGRVPVTEDIGLESVGIKTERGRIPVSDDFSTEVEGIYAIGDVIRGPMLAHKAEEEGVACVEQIVTGHSHVNYDAIPGVCYTDPEVSTVGKTEDNLKEAGVAYRKGTFPFMANGRAKALGNSEGFVKVLADAETDRILGVHIIGPRAGDLIAEAVAAIEFGASSEDIGRVCHAHPTLSECLKEAALGVSGKTLNF